MIIHANSSSWRPVRRLSAEGERKVQSRSRSARSLFEKTRTGLCFGLERLRNPSVSINAEISAEAEFRQNF